MILRIAATSFGVTLLVALILALQRAGIPGPFAVPVFRHLLFFQDYYAILPFAGALLLALVPQVRHLGEKLALQCGRHPLALAVLTALALAAGARWVYHGWPLSMDEYAMLFQARVFAQGHLSGALPPALIDWLFPEWMEQFFRVNREAGAVASGYWPGFSLLLTPFAALGVPWLLNPLLGGATVLLAHRLGLELFKSEERAGHVALLTLASPAVTANAISYYSMPAHLLANGLFMLLLLRPTPARAALAGLIGSLALVLHNPAPHALFALPWIVCLALRPGRVRLLGALFAGYAPLCLFLGWGWPRFIDHLGSGATLAAVATPSEMTGMLSQRLSGVLGWRPAAGLGAAQLGTLYKLWLWSVPGLVVLAALGAWQLRKDRWPWLPMILSALLTYLAYFFIRFDQGHGWGARYFHSAWLVLPLLAVAALGSPKKEKEEERSDLAGYAAGCALLSLAFLTAFRALQVEQFIGRHLAQMPSSASGSAQVLIVDPSSGYYAWDLPQNDPFLRGAPLRLTSRGPQLDQAMMAARFPQYRLLGADRRGSVWGAP